MNPSKPMRHRAPWWRDHRRVAEPDDSDDNDVRGRQGLDGKRGLVPRTIARRNRTPLPDCSAECSTPSPTPTLSTPQPIWINLPDISAKCASTDTLVEACQVLVRSMPPPIAQGRETRAPNRSTSDANSSNKGRFSHGNALTLLQSRSRRRPQKHIRRFPKHASNSTQSPFLKLPAEIRNIVYEYLIPKARILIVSTRPNKELQALNTAWGTEQDSIKRPRLQLYHHLDRKQLGGKYCIERNILLVCRQVKLEAEFFFYSRPTFCFDSSKNLTRFLNRASKPGISTIQSIELCDRGYGNPNWTKDEIFQQRYYQKWQRTCANAGLRLTNLKHLKLEADLHIWPLKRCSEVPDAAWKASVLQLTPRRIDKVEIKLRHYKVKRQSLIAEWQHKLEDEMMNEAGQRTRDEKEYHEVLRQLAEKERVAALAFKKFVVYEISQQDLIKSQKGSRVVHRNKLNL